MFGLILAIIIGGFAGWIAEKIMDADHGLFKNILLGVVGAMVARFLAGFVGLATTGLIGQLIAAVCGACLLIWIGRKLRS
ncbi:MAG: GlsB/YeaQ/YmgE family stress response membrane protein [Paracoccaceae bacterium]